MGTDIGYQEEKWPGPGFEAPYIVHSRGTFSYLLILFMFN